MIFYPLSKDSPLPTLNGQEHYITLENFLFHNETNDADLKELYKKVYLLKNLISEYNTMTEKEKAKVYSVHDYLVIITPQKCFLLLYASIMVLSINAPIFFHCLSVYLQVKKLDSLVEYIDSKISEEANYRYSFHNKAGKKLQSGAHSLQYQNENPKHYKKRHPAYGKTLYSSKNLTEKICRLKSHRLCVILVDRLESRLNIINLLIKEYDR